METLKTITALDICQPPPLRSALARLWVMYLLSGPTGQVVTAGSWLAEQVRILAGKAAPQAVVFAECASLVFVEFSKVLMPMVPECATSLMKLSQTFSTVLL